MAALLDGLPTKWVVLVIVCLIIGSLTYRIMRIRWLLKNNVGMYGMYDPLMYPMAMIYGNSKSAPPQQYVAGGSSGLFESASLPENRLF